jgi:23S rRNA (uridine2552-2'-O)-methyltransferase
MRLSPVLCSQGKAWAARQASDAFVGQARRDGFVARSAYKLQQIDDRFGIFSAEKTRAVLDLGAAPGGWTQVIRLRTHPQSVVFAVDLVSPRVQVPGAVFIRGDFTDEGTQAKLRDAMQSKRCASSVMLFEDDDLSGLKDRKQRDEAEEGGFLDVVTSDMCPNRSGGQEDSQRIAQLQLQALQYALAELALHGHFVCKVLGSTREYAELHELAARNFTQVKVSKPPASRAESSEAFLVCLRKLASPRLREAMARRGAARGTGGGMRDDRTGRVADYGLDDWPGFARESRSGSRFRRTDW